MKIFILVSFVVIVPIIVVIILDNLIRKGIFPPLESGKKRAGRRGESFATDQIRHVLREDDVLLTNVEISFDGRRTELDNLIINKYGVFIIEVKNYKGCLQGTEDDYEWEKYKDDGYGNAFLKNVKNPIRQVKRQVYLLAKSLDYYGVHVWVKGYVLFVQGNSPVQSEYVLSGLDDIDRVIHTFEKNRLTKTQTAKIVEYLK